MMAKLLVFSTSLFVLAFISLCLMAHPAQTLKPETQHLPSLSNLHSLQKPPLSSTLTNNEKIRIDTTTGLPVAMYDLNYRGNGDTPEEIAADFLKNNRHVLKLDSDESLSDLEHYKTFTSPAGSTVRYHQVYKSLLVYDTDIAVTIDKNNTVKLITCNYKPGIEVESDLMRDSTIPFRSIFQTASKIIGLKSEQEIRYKKSQMMIYQEEGVSHLAWKLNLVPRLASVDLELIYDAINGKIMRFNDLTFDLKGSDSTKSSNSKSGGNLRSRLKSSQGDPSNLEEERKLNFKQKDILADLLEPSNVQLFAPVEDEDGTWNAYQHDGTDYTFSSSTTRPTSPPALRGTNNTDTSNLEDGNILMEDYHQKSMAFGYVFDPDPLSTAKELSNQKTGFSDNADKDSPELTKQLVNVTLRDVELRDGIYSLKGPWAEIVDTEAPYNGLFEQSDPEFFFTRSESGFEAVNCYYHIDNTMRYINDELGIEVHPSLYEGGVRVDPHGLGGGDNSHYLSSTQELAFGEGGVDDAEDADVIIHELGHGIHDWITGGSYSREEGLSEGFGDYLAASYGRSKNQWSPSDPEYHHIYNWDGHNEYWGGRTTNLEATYPDDLKGNKHWDGSMWASCNMKIYDAIGRIKSDKAHLLGMSMTNSASNQLDAANAILQAAFNLDYEDSEVETMISIYRGCGYDVSYNFCGDGVRNGDEDCDGDDIGDIECMDIGCSRGKPLCSATCKLDYSACRPANNHVVFELNLKTDSYGEETSWTLKDKQGDLVYSGSGYSSSREFSERRCIPNKCHTFTIYDKFHDGMCCNWGKGSYQITFDGETVPGTDALFLDKASHTLGKCR